MFKCILSCVIAFLRHFATYKVTSNFQCDRPPLIKLKDKQFMTLEYTLRRLNCFSTDGFQFPETCKLNSLQGGHSF